MGFSVYTEDRLHERTYVEDPSIGDAICRVSQVTPREGLLWMIDPHGDTMLYALQLELARQEIRGVAHTHPALSGDVQCLDQLMESVVKRRGYLCVEGD